MKEEKKVLICYYDVLKPKYKVYNVIYNGIKVPKQYRDSFGDQIPGLKSAVISGMPINKSVWIVSIDNKPMLDKLRQYLLTVYGVTLDYVVAVLDDQSINQLWSNYKFGFIRKVNKYLDRIKNNGSHEQQVEKVLSYLDSINEQIQAVIISFGISDQDDVVGRNSIYTMLFNIVKQAYPQLNLMYNKESEHVNS